MLAVYERSVQRNAEISWLSREGQDATFGSNLKLTSCLLIESRRQLVCGDRLVERWRAAVTVLVVLSFSFRFCKYDDKVAMSCVKVFSIDCQSSAECMMTRSSA